MNTRPFPMIDHYMGQTVSEIGHDGDDWYVEFEGGARLYSTHPNYDKPDNALVGQALRLQVMSRDEMKLYFGPDENPHATVMNLIPFYVELSDPGYNEGERVNPNWPQEASAAGVEPSAPGDRAVEAPEEPSEDEEEEEGA